MTYDEYEAKRQAGELEPSDLDWFAEQSMNANDADPRNDEAPGVNDMIVRDRNSWERSIREYAAAKGVPFDQTMVDDVIRQVSYARNVGRDPGDFVRDAFRTIDQRAAPTLSGGGRGGDADLNRDGVADVGWTQGPGGQWTRTAVPATTSSAPVPSTGNRYAQMAAGGGGGMAGASFGDDFGDDFGAVPAAFGETYTALGRPSWLQGEYVPRQWTEQFVQREKPVELQTPYRLPTQAELEASPGYLAGASAMQRGMEHSAAAKGTVLSGGFVGRALPRALGEYAGGAYQNLVGNTLAARGQQYGEYSGDVARDFDQYRQRYGQFTDAESLRLGARNVNEQAFQGDVGNNRNQFMTRYNQYLDTAGLKRQAEQDLWSRNAQMTDFSLRAAALARPF